MSHQPANHMSADEPGARASTLPPPGGGKESGRHPAREARAAVRRLSPRSALLLTVGVILLSMNLRPAVVAVSPLLDSIRADTGTSTTFVSLLTVLPLLCFGLLAPLAPRLGSRFGVNVVLWVSMLALLAGEALRLVDSLTVLLIATVVVGGAIAVANVLVPGIIKREFPERPALMSGVYTMSLFGSAALTVGVILPVKNAAHLGWRPALALVGILAVLALVTWLPQALRDLRDRAATGARAAGRGAARPAGDSPVRGLWRHPVAWLVAVYFAMQSLSFYSAAAYLPTLFTDAGLSSGTAGWMLSFSNLLAVAGALVPQLLGRRVRPAVLVVVSAVLTSAAFAGLLTAPAGAAYLWMALLGIGQGTGLSLSVTFIVLRSPDHRHTAHLSSMAQCFGYVLAAVGPFAVGAVHQVTGGWAVPLLILIALAVPTVVCGLGSARKRYASHEVTAG